MSFQTSDRQLCILGSTGSIGVNALSVAKHLGIKVHSISAHKNYELLVQQALDHDVKRVVISDEQFYEPVKDRLKPKGIHVDAGHAALNDLASDSDTNTVITAIVGVAGLSSTLAACTAGKRVGIANKEPLVVAGELVMRSAREHNAEIIPIDSEHSAIFQCLHGHTQKEVKKIILTGSGGPLRGRTDLNDITKDEALNHPNWSMGDKITIDSATLMNKGLELIEAHHLFSLPAADIEILIHPESIIHSMVCFQDNSVLAQLGLPDMQIPIQYALTYPEHQTSLVDCPDFTKIGAFHFEQVNHQVFPSIQLAQQALVAGPLGPCVLNAANECAVQAFLDKKQSFLSIFQKVESFLTKVPRYSQATLEDYIACDQSIREQFVKQL